MATGNDKVGEAFVEIRASLEQLEKDFKTAEKKTKAGGKKLNGIMKKMSGVTLGGVARGASRAATAMVGLGVAMEAVSRATRNDLDQLDKLSTRLGVSTKFLQEAGFAASQSGVKMETLTMAMQRFTRRSAEAKEGTGEAKDAIKELGIQLTDSNGRMRSTEQLFTDAMRALSRVDDPAKRLRLAFKLFDSEGASLVQLADNFDNLTEAARRQGLVIDGAVIQKAVKANDKLDVLWRTIKANLTNAFVDFSDVTLAAAGALATVAHHAGVAWVRLKDYFNLDPTTAEELRDRIAEIGEELDSLTKQSISTTQNFESVFGMAFDPKNWDKRTKAHKIFLSRLVATRAELRKQREELEKQLETLEKQSDVPPPPGLDALTIKTNIAELDRQTRKFEEFTEVVDERTKMIGDFWDDLGDDASRTLAQMVTDGEVSFKALGEAFVREFTQRALQSLLISPIIQALGAGIQAVGGALFGGGATTQFGPFEGGLVTPGSDAGGQFQIPELNPGFRAPLPESGGFTRASPAVAVFNNTPAQVATATQLDGSVDVYISESAGKSVSSGGPLAGTLEDRYNLSPRALR